MIEKSIVISLRVKPYHLAKALDGLQTYDKSFVAYRLSDIARGVMLHGINYLTAALPIEPTAASRNTIAAMTRQNETKKQQNQAMAQLLTTTTPKAINQDIVTDAVKNVVTDFNPKDLIGE